MRSRTSAEAALQRSKRCASSAMRARLLYWASSQAGSWRAMRGLLPVVVGDHVIMPDCRGDVAQLGERRVRNAKVGSSILLVSTKKRVGPVLRGGQALSIRLKAGRGADLSSLEMFPPMRMIR